MTVIAIVILVLGLVAINLVFRQKSVGFKVVASVIFAGIFAALFVILFVTAWNSSEDPAEKRSMQMAQNKQLILINNSKAVLNVTINYSEFDSATKQEIQIKDSLQLGHETHNSKSSFQILAQKNDKQSFPKDFSIAVKDSLKKVIKVFDETEFLAKTTTLPENLSDKRTAEIWTLELN